jgi:hypothetical protein
MPFFSKKKTEDRTVIVSVREGLERITVEIHGRNRRGVWATVATAAAAATTTSAAHRAPRASCFLQVCNFNLKLPV